MTNLLKDIRVIDLTQLVAGPLCTLLLGDLGADVIKIEPPEGEAGRHVGVTRIGGESDVFLALNRNKRSVVLDMKQPRDVEALRALIVGCDVVVENFRPGTMEKWGLGYEALASDNPGLIYTAISGFGKDAPYGDRPALDPTVQAMSGIMQLTGTAQSGPLKTGFPLGDVVPPLFATIGVLAALHARRDHGRGQRVDVSMLDATIFAMTPREAYFFATGSPPPRLGNGHYQMAPYNTYETADGRLLMLIAHTEKFWRVLLKALGDEALAGDHRFSDNDTRVRHRVALDESIAALVRARPYAHWEAVLSEAGAVFAPVRQVEEAFADPVVADSMVHRMEHPAAGSIRVLRNPMRFSEGGNDIRRAPPLLGADTASVLNEWN
ncbi:MAG: Alpha-methylacyl-CoA racemase [Ramlibacter sp.]|nr:Alpha-methylacyl-CoA racemase [Ramlibacter sp.]